MMGGGESKLGVQVRLVWGKEATIMLRMGEEGATQLYRPKQRVLFWGASAFGNRWYTAGDGSGLERGGRGRGRTDS